MTKLPKNTAAKQRLSHAAGPLYRLLVKVFKPPRYKEARINNWDRRSDLILAFFAVIFLVVYALPIVRPDLPDAALRACNWTSNVVWIVFAADYLFRLYLAKHRWSYIRYHLFDLLIVALPFFQPLRLLRLVFLLRVLNRRAENSLRGQISSYVIAAAGLITLVGALAELDVERNAAGAQITSFGRALWWAFVTITTVGYGDLTPVTSTGRLVATGMMLFGVALLGTVTATLASWLVENVADEDASQQDSAELEAIHSLSRQVSDLQREVASLRGELSLNSTSQTTQNLG